MSPAESPPVRSTAAEGGPSPTAHAVASFPLDPRIIEILGAQGIRSFYPPQAEALRPVLAGESVLLACPTASGKSMVAYLGLLRAVQAGRTGLYLVPLRALAQEKYDDLSAFASMGLRIGLSMGDFDLPSASLEKLDILVATSEKADGLLRKGSPWLDRLGTVVADEIHLMRDPDRGPTLEVSLTRLRRHHPELQVIGLSATVGNSESVAQWLGARHIFSEFRPVPLKLGVYREGMITFTDLSTRSIAGPGEALPRLVRGVIKEGGQAIVFVNTRKASEQCAQGLVETVRALLTPAEREACRRTAEELTTSGEEQTGGVRRLSELVPFGVAFHNASLTNTERRIVERAFLDRTLKALAATPTLAAGINLPARRVIVRDTTRYDARVGTQTRIPALEVQQMCGRAGRPRFDSAGEAVLVARTIDEEERLMDDYLSAPPENIESRLAAEPALRMHVLALVASGEVHTERELEGFFAQTYYGFSLPLDELTMTVGRVRAFLEEHEFLFPGSPLRATAFGHLTSELYFDPLTALVLRQAIERAPIGTGPFPLLAAIAATPDLPALFLRRGEEADLLGLYTDHEAELLIRPEEEPLDLDLETYLSTLKTASILEAWINETPIVQLTERFGIGAGDLRAKVEDGEWLLFGTSRIALKFNRRLTRAADDLALRVRYGVREELLDLVRLRGIGRVRSRQLFAAGLRDRDDLRAATMERIESALGSRSLAEMVVKQLRPQRARAEEGTSGPMVPEAPVPVPGPATAPPSPPQRRIEDF
ncbi:MAG: DEAD/DEAH box helicase [Thermoplasmata archaeon]